MSHLHQNKIHLIKISVLFPFRWRNVVYSANIGVFSGTNDIWATSERSFQCNTLVPQKEAQQRWRSSIPLKNHRPTGVAHAVSNDHSFLPSRRFLLSHLILPQSPRWLAERRICWTLPPGDTGSRESRRRRQQQMWWVRRKWAETSWSWIMTHSTLIPVLQVPEVEQQRWFTSSSISYDALMIPHCMISTLSYVENLISALKAHVEAHVITVKPQHCSALQPDAEQQEMTTAPQRKSQRPLVKYFSLSNKLVWGRFMFHRFGASSSLWKNVCEPTSGEICAGA